MGWAERINEMLEPNQCMYAVGQGALGEEIDRLIDIVEGRYSDTNVD